MFDKLIDFFSKPKARESWKRSKGKGGRGATSSIIRSSHVASRRYQNLTPGRQTQT